MPFGDVPSLSNYTGRMAEADRYDPNEFTASRENYERHRYNRASFDALMRRLEPPDMQRQRAKVAAIEDQNDALFDLEFREPERQQLKRRELGRDALAEQERFFSQDPMRREQEAASLRQLRARYADPAIIKGMAELQRELARGGAAQGVAGIQGRTARDVAGITGGSREREEAIRSYGDVASTRTMMGDPQAGPEASGELGTRMGPPEKTATIGGPRGLQAYADEHGITLDEAIEFAESRGYVVIDETRDPRGLNRGQR